MHLARTYWGIPSSSFEIGGQYHLPPSACGLRGSGWYWPPISQDSDGIPQYVLARCMVFLHCYQSNYEPIVIYLPLIRPYITKNKITFTRSTPYVQSGYGRMVPL